MRVMGMLVILVIAMFIILLSFMTINDKQTNSSEKTLATNTQSASGAGDTVSTPFALPGNKQDLQLQYIQEQLKNKRSETELSYQQKIELQRMEYNNLTSQQRMLHEKEMQKDAHSNTEKLRQQELQQAYLLKQQEMTQLDKEKQYEAGMTDKLLTFEKEKLRMSQTHIEALALQKSNAQQQSALNTILVFSALIFTISFAYFIISSHNIHRRKELAKLEHEKLFALKQQEAMQETRIKVLESIADLPGSDKKEIIEGLVGLNNRTYEELEDKTVKEPPIEIELTDLNPPQMKQVPKG
ncbi:MAG: hypothetical protein KAG20_05775 [Cocleimonas sp.]|nr:hypothetical protein [Cocleimonas sp.]